MRGKKIAKPVVALAPAPIPVGTRRAGAPTVAPVGVVKPTTTREEEQVTASPTVEEQAVPSEVVGYPLDHSALKQYGLITRA